MKHILKSIVSNLLSSVNLNLPRNLKGTRLRIPLIRGIKVGISSEPWLFELIDKLLQVRQGIFLDVGVNLGQTLIKLKSIEPERGYVGFEPNPICVSYVRELIKKNRFTNCTIVPVGLFNKDGLLNLAFTSESDVGSAASLIEGFRPDHKTVWNMLVPVFRFETVAEWFDYEEIGVIKIDVEGAELEVIESIYSEIQRYRPIMILEVLPVYSDENKLRKDRQEKLQLLLSRLDYVLFRVKKSAKDSYGGLQEVQTIGTHSDLSQCDYLGVPREVSATLANW